MKIIYLSKRTFNAIFRAEVDKYNTSSIFTAIRCTYCNICFWKGDGQNKVKRLFHVNPKYILQIQIFFLLGWKIRNILQDKIAVKFNTESKRGNFCLTVVNIWICDRHLDWKKPFLCGVEAQVISAEDFRWTLLRVTTFLSRLQFISG